MAVALAGLGSAACTFSIEPAKTTTTVGSPVPITVSSNAAGAAEVSVEDPTSGAHFILPDGGTATDITCATNAPCTTLVSTNPNIGQVQVNASGEATSLGLQLTDSTTLRVDCCFTGANPYNEPCGTDADCCDGEHCQDGACVDGPATDRTSQRSLCGSVCKYTHADDTQNCGGCGPWDLTNGKQQYGCGTNQICVNGNCEANPCPPADQVDTSNPCMTYACDQTTGYVPTYTPIYDPAKTTCGWDGSDVTCNAAGQCGWPATYPACNTDWTPLQMQQWSFGKVQWALANIAKLPVDGAGNPYISVDTDCDRPDDYRATFTVDSSSPTGYAVAEETNDFNNDGTNELVRTYTSTSFDMIEKDIGTHDIVEHWHMTHDPAYRDSDTEILVVDEKFPGGGVPAFQMTYTVDVDPSAADPEGEVLPVTLVTDGTSSGTYSDTNGTYNGKFDGNFDGTDDAADSTSIPYWIFDSAPDLSVDNDWPNRNPDGTSTTCADYDHLTGSTSSLDNNQAQDAFKSVMNNGYKCLNQMNPQWAGKLRSAWKHYSIRCVLQIPSDNGYQVGAAAVSEAQVTTHWWTWLVNLFSRAPTGAIEWQAGFPVTENWLLHEMLHLATGVGHADPTESDPSDQIIGCATACFADTTNHRDSTRQRCAACIGPSVGACDPRCDFVNPVTGQKLEDDCASTPCRGRNYCECPQCSAIAGGIPGYYPTVGECNTACTMSNGLACPGGEVICGPAPSNVVSPCEKGNCQECNSNGGC